MASEFFITNGITLVSMFFVEIVLAIYFTKAKTNTSTGKAFLSMIITTMVVMLSSIVWGALATKESGLTELVGRITCFLVVSWNFTLMFYITVVFRDNMTEEQIKKQNKTTQSKILTTFFNFRFFLILPPQLLIQFYY